MASQGTSGTGSPGVSRAALDAPEAAGGAPEAAGGAPEAAGGAPEAAGGAALAAFNAEPDESRLRAELAACCAAPAWIAALLAGRPFADEEAVCAGSDAAIAELTDAELAEALRAHPRIGDRPAGPEGEWSRQEQAGTASAGATVRAELAEANAAYEQRFGHVYLVCATGRSAEELLAVCRSRLDNPPAAERAVVLGELAKISRLRLAKLLHPVVAG
jgi:2-oxo-4-hydroxy-4-carboxy-5-ureidoimidazoline decarboxylase